MKLTFFRKVIFSLEFPSNLKENYLLSNFSGWQHLHFIGEFNVWKLSKVLMTLPGYVENVVKSLSHVRLFATPWTVAHQAPPFMGFPRQEYWSGLPFPSPGDLPNPGIEPRSPALQADALTSELPGNHGKCNWMLIVWVGLKRIKSEKQNVGIFYLLKMIAC